MPTRYRVTIHAEGKLYKTYRTQGSVSITSSAPMIDAAKSLLASGADPASTLEGRWEGALVGPATLASITKVRKFPKLDYKTPTYAN